VPSVALAQTDVRRFVTGERLPEDAPHA